MFIGSIIPTYDLILLLNVFSAAKWLKAATNGFLLFRTTRLSITVIKAEKFSEISTARIRPCRRFWDSNGTWCCLFLLPRRHRRPNLFRYHKEHFWMSTKRCGIVGRQKEYYWRWIITPFINVSAQKEKRELTILRVLFNVFFQVFLLHFAIKSWRIELKFAERIEMRYEWLQSWKCREQDWRLSLKTFRKCNILIVLWTEKRKKNWIRGVVSFVVSFVNKNSQKPKVKN